MYEICIFTAAMKDVYKSIIQYADSILDIIDKDYKLIKYRLYRNHTSIVGNGFVKVISLLNRDISKLGRDLSKVIIIDNLAENFRLQINNGLAIRTWNDDMKDSQLVDLMKILQDIHSMRIPDVRVIIKKIKEDLSKTKNTLNPYTNIEISKLI